jgi:hypothetical protein
MDDSSGPSRPRRSSDPLLGSRDIAPGLRRFSQDPSSLPEDESPPPKYTEAPALMNGDALDGRTRQALLGGSSGDGPRKMSEDGLEPNREDMRLASLEQRKALWWRNTLVTAMFIASWYVRASTSQFNR